MPPKKGSKSSNGPSNESKREPVADYRFEARRPNNPPAGLVSSDHATRETPRTRYAYDPHLSPQLVWADKPGLRSIEVEEQAGVDVDDVTLHIHERVSTRAILDAVQRPEPKQLDLFADPALPLHEAVKFYTHNVDWANRLVLGDSLLVMGSLLSREQMRGKVQMIYLDPPYGVNYKSNFQPRIDQRDVREDDSGLTREPEQIQAYRDTWTLGVHSYLTYLRDRLLLCRELLAETGSIFVQISDENVHRVRLLLDEVFGAENFVSQVSFKKTSGAGSFGGGTNVLASISDFIVWYAKDAGHVKYRQLYGSKVVQGSQYTWVETSDGQIRSATKAETNDGMTDGRFFRPDQMTSQTVRQAQTTVFDVEVNGRVYRPSRGGWKTNRTGVDNLRNAGRLMGIGNTLCFVRYFDDFPVSPLTNFWTDTTTSGFADPKVYVVQTNTRVIQRCMLMTTDPGDLVLDPTCGSGTTAYVAEQWGRRWITCDTSRVAVALARQRLMTATFPYYRLGDEGRGVDGGFVYKTVPHIQLSDYARNTRIDPIVERYAPLLAEADPGEDAGKARRLRRERRAEIDKVVAEDSERETLYDQPEVVTRVTRVSGPFTVEAIPPAALQLQAVTPILGAPEEIEPDDGSDEVADSANADPAARTILVDEAASHIPNLLADLARDGVTFPDNRVLRFAELAPHAGGVIHAEGTPQDDADLDRVGISFGPRSGAVTMAQVENALYEARARLLDAVIFCGFAFEPEAQAYISDENRGGRVKTFMAHIRPDVVLTDARGESLLKTRQDSQVFAVFGEPEVELLGPDGDGAYRVEMRGVDVYDPLTGLVHSANVGQVAAWFLDSDYDRRAFCICQAFFPNVDAWEKIGRALKGKLDEERLSALRGSVSLPFKPGRHQRVAVKVIDQRGNEVMRVLSLERAAPLAYPAGRRHA